MTQCEKFASNITLTLDDISIYNGTNNVNILKRDLDRKENIGSYGIKRDTLFNLVRTGKSLFKSLQHAEMFLFSVDIRQFYCLAAVDD